MSKNPRSAVQRLPLVPLPASSATQDILADYEVLRDEHGVETGKRNLLSLSESLTALQALRQTRYHHLHHLFPVFTSPLAKTKANPKGKGKEQPLAPAKNEEDEKETIPPHKLFLLGSCRMVLGPLSFEGVSFWECRWETAISKPMVNGAPMPIRTSVPKPSQQANALAGPSKGAHVPPSTTGSSITAPQSRPTPGSIRPPNAPPAAPAVDITKDLINQVNSQAESHPWLSRLIQRAATHQADLSELRRLGGVVEILSKGFILPRNHQEGELAAGDPVTYMNRVIAAKEARANAATARIQSVNPAATPVTPATSTPSGPKYPLVVISFAENPTIKFVLPTPFAYTSFRPEVASLTNEQSTNSLPMVRKRGRMICSTFLPSKGWGTWISPSSESTRKRKSRTEIPVSSDKPFGLAGMVVPPGSIEPVNIRFEDMAEQTWMHLSRIARVVDDCLAEERAEDKKKLELDKKREEEKKRRDDEKEAEKQKLREKEEEQRAEREKVTQVEGKSTERVAALEERDEDIEDVIVVRSTVPTEPAAPVPADSGSAVAGTALEDDPDHPSKRPKRDIKRKRWSEGEEADAERPKQKTPRQELKEDVVQDDDPEKSFKSRVFKQLLKRVPQRQYLKLRLSAPLPEDLVRASTHPFDPILRNIVTKQAAVPEPELIVPAPRTPSTRGRRPRGSGITRGARKIRTDVADSTEA